VTTPASPDAPRGAGTSSGPGTPPPGTDATADELVADIEATRAELGDTVDALSEKFDVKTQAQHALDDAKQRAVSGARAAQARGTEIFTQAKAAATDEQGNLTPQARTIAGRVAAGVVATVVLRAIWKRARR